jgi:hypothetical protein
MVNPIHFMDVSKMRKNILEVMPIGLEINPHSHKLFFLRLGLLNEER